MPVTHCIVAGVGPGMGLAIATRFARGGYAIAMLARKPSSLADYEEEIAAEGVRVRGYPTDLSDAGDIRRAFREIRAAFGPAGLLVYNAAGSHESAAMTLDSAVFTRDLNLSVTGALLCAQQVYPDMQAARSGCILFTGGGLALFPEYGTGLASLTAGKSALRGLALVMAKELARDGIHVAMVTIAGTVQAGTPFDPAKIAEEYWRLHLQPREEWETERVYRGEAAGAG